MIAAISEEGNGEKNMAHTSEGRINSGDQLDVNDEGTEGSQDLLDFFDLSSGGW